MLFTGKTVFRLLTWRPAGAEGEHVTTQALSDKQLVRKCVLVFYLLNHLIFFIPDISVSDFLYNDLSVLLSGLHFPEVTGYTEPFR